MRRKLIMVPILAHNFYGWRVYRTSQVTYQAEEGRLPFSSGRRCFNFSTTGDISIRVQVGITIWADWRLPHMPRYAGNLTSVRRP